MGVHAGPGLVLGAGATKACAGPLTKEILWEAEQSHASIEREDCLDLLDEILLVVLRL